MQGQKGQGGLGTGNRTCGLASVLATLSLRRKGEDGKLVGQQACKINRGGRARERIFSQEKRGKTGMPQKPGGTRKEMHATEMGERGRAARPTSVPFPGDTSRPLCTAPLGTAPERSHSRPYQSRAPKYLGSLFKVWGGERRKARAASEVPKHSLMKILLAWGGPGEAAPGPGWVPRVGSASAAAATHVVVVDHVIAVLVLVVVDHSHGAHQLAHGHLLPGAGPGPR